MKSIIRKVTSTALTAAMVLSLTPSFEITSMAASSVPEGFVYTKGTEFMCDGAPYYYGGTNCYYLIYKSKEAVDNVFKDCKDMGLNVIRVWGHLDAGVKTGQVNSNGYAVFQNSADGSGEKDGVYFQYFDKEQNRPVINEGADGLQRLDYVIAQAEKNNVKLILTFTNYWQAFGGMEQYCKWVQEAGLGSNLQVDDFYTNETCKQWYKDYVKQLLNHKNVYTGEKLMDSEAVFAWELCNEPRAEKKDQGCNNDLLYNWAKEMSEYVKSVDPYHMVSVGDEGFFNYDRQGDIMKNVVDSDYAFSGGAGVDFEKLMSIDTIDFGTPHFYCDSWNLKITGTGDNGGDDDMDWLKLHAQAAQKANKPVVLEEFGLKDKTIRDQKYKSWLDLLDGTTFDGKYQFQGFNYWMIASYMEDGTYYPDYDSYTVYGPAEVEAEKGTANARNYIVESAKKMNQKNICNTIDDGEFDKANAKDVVLTANMKMGSPSSVQLNGKNLTKGTDYTINGTTITIKSSYLNSLEPSEYVFTLICTEGNNPTFIIDVDDSSIIPAIIDKESITIDRNVKKCKDVVINMTLNGNTLNDILNNGTKLVKGSDYTVSGSTVTIKKSYLTTLQEGNAVLTFDFTPAKDKNLSIKVEDTTGDDEFDVFDSYTSSDDLWSSYTRNTNGNEVSLSLVNKNGSQALAFGYNIGNPNYCGVTKNVGKDLSAYKGVSLWIEGDGSGNEITIQLEDKDGRYREAYITLDFTGGKTVFLPFADFVAPGWQGGSDGINTSAITKYSIYAGGSGKTTGTVYLDNIIAADSANPDPVETDISDCSVSLSGYSFEYTGSAITPSVTVKNGSTTLTNGTDYTVSYKNNVNVGTATAVITGIGNYTGTVSVSFTINKKVVTEKDISNCTISIPKSTYTYTGSAIKPAVTVKDGSKTLTLKTDYLVRYVDNVNVGTASIIIAGTGDYTGRVEKTFEIVDSTVKNLSSCTISLSKTSFAYTGSAIKPTVTVKDGSKVLTRNTDYVIRYVDNVNVGTATVVIAGRGNYTGTVNKTFQITPATTTNISNCSISLNKLSFNYTGNAVKPAVTVKNGSKVLTLGTDYAVRYVNNVNRGTATVVISGKGNYSGTVQLNFTIK